MGWEDRPYYRDRPSTPGGPLAWLLTGSLPIATLFGIRVRVHASLVVLAVLTLLFPQQLGGIYGSFSFLLALFAIVLLHEFGHCIGSRMVGGDPRNILMTPLGGLAFVDSPRRPWATAWTVAAGPLVNVIICAVCVGVLMLSAGWSALDAISWYPFSFNPHTMHAFWRVVGDSQFLWWTWWIFATSYGLLLFNLLPIFPLDGGQLMQALLWVKIGRRRSMMFSTTSGLVGAVLLAMLSIATRSVLLLVIAFTCFHTCLQIRQGLLAEGPGDWGDEMDYSASLNYRERRPKSGGILSWFKRKSPSAKPTFKAPAIDARMEAKIDAILDKVRDQGMQSLTSAERRTLKQATENQRRKSTPR